MKEEEVPSDGTRARICLDQLARPALRTTVGPKQAPVCQSVIQSRAPAKPNSFLFFEQKADQIHGNRPDGTIVTTTCGRVARLLSTSSASSLLPARNREPAGPNETEPNQSAPSIINAESKYPPAIPTAFDLAIQHNLFTVHPRRKPAARTARSNSSEAATSKQKCVHHGHGRFHFLHVPQG